MSGPSPEETATTTQSPSSVTQTKTTTPTGLFQASTTSPNVPPFGLFSQNPNASRNTPTPPATPGQSETNLSSTSSFGTFRTPQSQPTSVYKTSHFGTSMFGTGSSTDTSRFSSPFSSTGGAASGPNTSTPSPDVKLVFSSQKAPKNVPQKNAQNVGTTFPKWYAAPEKSAPQIPPAFSFANQMQAVKPSPEKNAPTKRVTFNFAGANKDATQSGKSESNVFKKDSSNPFSKPGGIFREEIKKVFQSQATKLISSLTKSPSEKDAQNQAVLEIEEPNVTETVAATVEPAKMTGIKSRLSLPLRKSTPKVTTDKASRSKPPTREETAIVCKEVSDNVNNNQFMKSHFSKFGKIKYLRCNTDKQQTIVHYLDHESASAAKAGGFLIGPGIPAIKIFWRNTGSKLKDGRRRSSSTEVEEELRSMAAGEFLEPKILPRVLKESPGEKDTPKKSAAKDAAKKTAAKDTPKKTVAKEQAPKKKKPETSSTVSAIVSDESLHSILERSAVEIGDRYKILDARDKLIRMKTHKQSDINKATAVVGTCPDMCPEKERYSRTETYGLSLFEQYQPGMVTATSGKVNLKAVIKEYSRSSADQEEPLSHELRPPQTLQLTMDYLLCNIMDMDSGAGEWFDFIWNRTRSIRKDLTQQHLCDPVCVSLVEKCARFHIHCSAALCHEDISVFDPKINNENLTKCQQTLKHFYDDLAEKGINCPNEAEFRAYDILLNLNEGDILRQVQHFGEPVRESQIIRFATEVFFAHSNNNYVRFFRLVRSATYLAACVLQRYFQHVRTKAVVAICKAYRKPNSVEQFSVAKLTNLLGFENMVETEQFCHWLELQTTSDAGVLLRKPNVPTSGAPAPTQPINLIHSKRQTSIGQVVNGGPLSPNPYLAYEPHDSFDSSGRLKKEAYDAQDQALKAMNQLKNVVQEGNIANQVLPLIWEDKTVQSTFKSPVATVSLPLSSTPVVVEEHQFSQHTIPEEVVMNIVTDLSMEVVHPLSSSVAQEVILDSKMKFSDSFANQTAATIISDTVHHMARDIVANILEEAQTEKTELEELQRKKQCVADVSSRIVEDVVAEESRVISKQAISEARDELRESIATEMLLSICQETTASECSLVAFSVYQDEKAWAEKIRVFVNEKKLERVRKMFRRWHSICVSRRTFEQVKLMFPSGPLLGFETAKRIKLDAFSLLSIEDQDKQAKKTNRHITADLCCHLLEEELSKEPINVLNVVKDSLVKNCKLKKAKKIFWKIALYLPFESKEHSLSDWITNKFDLSFENHTASMGSFLISKPKVDMGNDSNIHLYTSVQAWKSSKRLSTGSPVSSRTLKGLSGLLVMIELQDCTSLVGIVKKCKDNLQEFLSRSKPLVPAIPLAFVIINNNPFLTTQEENYLLHLDFLKENGLVCQYQVTIIHPRASSTDITKKIEDILVWLSENTPEIPVITSSYLEDFLEDGITSNVLNPVFEDLAHKQKRFHSDLQSPNSIVCLYNAALQFLADVVSQDYLKCISWPAPEFCLLKAGLPSPNWNEAESLRNLYDLITSLQLREGSNRIASCPFNVEDAYNWVQKFSEGLEPRIRSQFYSQFEAEVRRPDTGDAFNVPWAKLLTTVFSLMCRLKIKDHNEKDIAVHYFETDLEKFQFPTDWLVATSEASTVELTLERSHVDLKKSSEISTQVPSYWNRESPQAVKHLPLLGKEYYSSKSAFRANRSVYDLNQTISQERKESEAFTERLRALAKCDSITNLSSDFESSQFGWSSGITPQRHTNKNRLKKSVLPYNLDDSFYYIKHLLRNEKESTMLFDDQLKLLDKM